MVGGSPAGQISGGHRGGEAATMAALEVTVFFPVSSRYGSNLIPCATSPSTAPNKAQPCAGYTSYPRHVRHWNR